MASLYHYFKRDSAVPISHGALSSSVPSSAIDSANRLVKSLVKERAKIAKCATEIGVTCAIKKLSKRFPNRLLKESTVRTWMNKCKEELK